MKLSELRKKLSRKRSKKPAVHTEKRGDVECEYVMTSDGFDGRQATLTDWGKTTTDGVEVKEGDKLTIGIDPASKIDDFSLIVIGTKYRDEDLLEHAKRPTYGIIRIDNKKPLGFGRKR